MAWYDRPSWADLTRRLDQSQAEHFGEQFEVEPQVTRPNKRSAPDLARPLCRFPVVYMAHDPRSTPTARKASAVAQHEIAIEYHALDLPFTLRQGDRLTRCATGERFDVLTSLSDGNGHMRVTLGEFRAMD